MRRAPAVLVTVLALAVTAALVQVDVNGTIAKPAQAAAEQEQRSQPAKDDGDDGGGVPIWAGIGLMLLAAVPARPLPGRGTAAACGTTCPATEKRLPRMGSAVAPG